MGNDDALFSRRGFSPAEHHLVSQIINKGKRQNRKPARHLHRLERLFENLKINATLDMQVGIPLMAQEIEKVQTAYFLKELREASCGTDSDQAVAPQLAVVYDHTRGLDHVGDNSAVLGIDTKSSLLRVPCKSAISPGTRTKFASLWLIQGGSRFRGGGCVASAPDTVAAGADSKKKKQSQAPSFSTRNKHDPMTATLPM